MIPVEIANVQNLPIFKKSSTDMIRGKNQSLQKAKFPKIKTSNLNKSYQCAFKQISICKKNIKQNGTKYTELLCKPLTGHFRYGVISPTDYFADIQKMSVLSKLAFAKKINQSAIKFPELRYKINTQQIFTKEVNERTPRYSTHTF